MTFSYCSFLLVLVACFAARSKAFEPRRFQVWVGSSPNSASHESITDESIRQIGVQWFTKNANTYCKPGANFASTDSINVMFQKCYDGVTTKQFESTVWEIVDEIAILHTDRRAALHFNSEQLVEGNNLLVAEIENIRQLLDNNLYPEARSSLGKIFSMLQDFYAHTNWVELNSGGSNVPVMSTLGSPNGIKASDVSSASEATCSSCSNHIAQSRVAEFVHHWLMKLPGHTLFEGDVYDCSGSTQPSVTKLTSGYKAGELDTSFSPIHRPTGKCAYGGLYDSLGGFAPTGGLNKDQGHEIYSPMHDKHGITRSVAIEATVQILTDLWTYAGDAKLGELLSFIYNQQSDLGIIIDTTGSMDPYIEAAKQASYAIIDNDKHPNKYILVPFNDPTYGPATVTTDAAVFKSRIAALGASGGGDIPELCMNGLLLGVQDADPFTPLFVFTDANSKNQDLESQVLSIANEKSLSINFIIGQSGSDYSEYYRMATKTGGTALASTADLTELEHTAGIIANSINSNSIQLVAIGNVNADVTKQIHVDNSSPDLTIMLSRESISRSYDVTPTLLSASGAQVPLVAIIQTSSTKLYTASIPDSATEMEVNAGYTTYTLRVTFPASYGTADTYLSSTVTVRGSSSVDIQVKLEAETADGNLVDVGSHPSVGTNIWLYVTTVGSSDYSVSMVSLLGLDGAILAINECPPLNVTTSCFTNITVPAENFYVSAILSNGNATIQRMVSRPITPTQLALTTDAPSSNVLLPGASMTATFVAKYYGPSSTITISGTASPFLGSIQPNSATLNSGESFNGTITVNVPSSATPGSTSRIQITATSSLGDSNNIAFTVAVGRPGAPDNTPPECEVIQNSINTDCAITVVDDCRNFAWNALVEVSDVGSGLSSVTVASKNGTTNATVQPFTPGLANTNVSVSLSGDCCISQTTVSAMDKAGWTSHCELNRPAFLNLPSCRDINCTVLSDGLYSDPHFTCTPNFFMCSGGGCYEFVCAASPTEPLYYNPTTKQCEYKQDIPGC